MIKSKHIENGEINLCWLFYDLMKYRRKGVVQFKLAITMLEDVMDTAPIKDMGMANRFIKTAMDIAYGC